MYLPNKYTTWYNNIINHATIRTLCSEIYTETHHILPRSLGGSNDPENLVRLTAREHYICHHLLCYMTTGKSRSKMINAFWMMINVKSKDQDRYIKINSLSYEQIRIAYSNVARKRMLGHVKSPITLLKLSQSSKRNGGPSEKTKRAAQQARIGSVHTEESKQKMSAAKIGKPRGPMSEAHKEAIRQSRLGHTVSEESRRKISESLRGRSGNPHTTKSKEKISKANKGKKHSEDSKQKMRSSHAKRFGKDT